MGYASDMQDLVVQLANIIKGTANTDTVGKLKDYITYSEECRGLRSHLYEIDPDCCIVPDTALYVHTTEDNDGYMEAATVMKADERLITLYKDTLEQHDIQDEEGVLAWYYERYMSPEGIKRSYAPPATKGSTSKYAHLTNGQLMDFCARHDLEVVDSDDTKIFRMRCIMAIRGANLEQRLFDELGYCTDEVQP
jgi:hypothetical protein